ncbi:MAG: dihydropteroate synthase [Bacteroidales bacterium]|nr:dihydropteroate synthase [Bacteroidales bacterium]
MEQPRVKIMGIINITEDSFFSDSRVSTIGEIKSRISQMVTEGADILDFGACSTRPGSTPIPEDEEWQRISLALEGYAQYIGEGGTPAQISIDTFRSGIVRKAYDRIGPFIVNDISAGEDDSQMLKSVGELGLKYIAMHKRGTPENMQQHCDYKDIIEDILQYFREFGIRAAQAGITDWVLDPGFGFSKTIDQNYQLLEELDRFKILGREILVGISRKSFIYRKLGITPEEALPETTRLHRLAIARGADILRVHDVAEAKGLIL